jgi:hypothetical protein
VRPSATVECPSCNNAVIVLNLNSLKAHYVTQLFIDKSDGILFQQVLPIDGWIIKSDVTNYKLYTVMDTY